ncbi:MAG: hypothetical protein GY756_17690 [bacterium]|nr:hypothetical protein [bacterium]
MGSYPSTTPKWREEIAQSISLLSGVLVVKNIESYSFIGNEFAVIICREMYNYLEKAIIRIAKNEIHGNAKYHYRENYKYGMAVRLSWRIEDLKTTEQWVSIKEKINAIERNYLDTLIKPKKRKNKDVINNTAFFKGLLKGKDISLTKQIYGGNGKTKSLDYR